MKNSRDGRTPPGPDVAGLQAFALEDDRLPPPAFVGRRDIISDIEHAVAQAAAGGTAVRGRTRLVFGAPGAGKTALLYELARRWRARAADGDASAPVPVDCEPGDLTSPVAFTEAVLSALIPDSSHDVATSTTTEGGGGVPGVAGLSVSRTTSVPFARRLRAGRTHPVGGDPRGDAARAPHPSRRAARGRDADHAWRPGWRRSDAPADRDPRRPARPPDRGRAWRPRRLEAGDGPARHLPASRATPYTPCRC